MKSTKKLYSEFWIHSPTSEIEDGLFDNYKWYCYKLSRPVYIILQAQYI